MLSARDILLGVVVPLIVSAAIALLGQLAWKRVAIGGALAVGVGFVVGCGLVFGMKVPPGNAFEWVVPMGALAAVVGTAAEIVGFRWRWIWGVVMVGVAWGVAGPLMGVGMVAALAAVGWVWWGLWDGALKRAGGAWAGVVMTGVAGLVSLVLMLSDSQRIGQMGLALVGSVVAVWVLGWAMKRDLWRGAGLAWAVVIYGLLLDGKYWAGLTWPNAVLLLAAPLLAWVGDVAGVRRLTGWKRSAVRVAAVVVPVAIAVVLAVIEFQRAQQSVGSEYY